MLLDDLYFGNLCPTEDAVSHDPRYSKINQEIIAQRTALEKNLSPAQMAQVDQLHQLLNELLCCEAQAKFEYGFVMGAKLMQEVHASSNFHK